MAALVLAWVGLASAALAAPAREDDATDALLQQYDNPKAKPEPEPKPKPKPKPKVTEKPEPKAEEKAEEASKPEPEPEPEPDDAEADADEQSKDAASGDDAAADDESGEAKAGDEPAPDEKPATPPPPKKSFSHYKMGLLEVGAGWGFAAIVPYKDGQFCGEFSGDSTSDTHRKAFCTGAAPWAMAFTAGYGVHPRIDLVLGVRLAVQKRSFHCKNTGDPSTCKGLFNDSLSVGLMPGFRGWFSDPVKMVKIGGELDFVWLYESFKGYRNRKQCTGPNDLVGGPCPVAEGPIVSAEHKIRNNDIGVRLGPVLQIDPHRNVGILLQPAARMGFLRWFEFAFEVNLAVQARFP